MVMCEKVCGLSLYWFTLTLHPEDSKSVVPIGLMCIAIFLFLVAMDIKLLQGIQCIGPYWCLDLQRLGWFSITSDIHVGEKKREFNVHSNSTVPPTLIVP
jgi:hypothetical protein